MHSLPKCVPVCVPVPVPEIIYIDQKWHKEISGTHTGTSFIGLQ